MKRRRFAYWGTEIFAVATTGRLLWIAIGAAAVAVSAVAAIVSARK